MLKKMKDAPVRVIPNPIKFPDELPVCERREEIREAISQHQVVIIAGETGSGKTTQIPKICLELGRGQEARIGHTQPRRLAARRVAERIADELESELGGLVGYKVRFNDSVAPSTAIKLMTDGILLAELQRDRELRDYDTLIIDEAHERSLNIDFILGYLRALLPKRPDLKVIITSATIDVDRFSQHFDNAPVIEVSGRLFPVEVHYLGDSDGAEDGVEDQIVRAVDGIVAEDFGPRGDVLIFLPGEREIRDLSRRLKGDERRQILPLYARLSAAEQNRVFKPTGSGMRVVLATNVAETSLTVPGIRYVIDPGTARVSRYSHRTRLQRLPVERISQSSADQRKGRCGRVAAGVCLRLYSEQDFLARPQFTDPEILRTNLAAVVLKMLELGLGDVQKFPFVDPPEGKMVRDGQRLLEELGAISARGKLTSLGRKMARLPVDPKLARMVHAAGELKCLEEVLVVVSALAVQDPRDRPAEKRAQADQAHARFNHPRSDFLSWLNLWNYYEEQRQSLSQNQFRKLCQREFLSFMRLREWREVHSQLVIACRQVQLRPGATLNDETDFEGVHKALLSGLLGQVAQLDEGRKYNATRNRSVQIFPGSVLHKKPPKWLVAAEVVETSQVYARQCAAIDPKWLLRINPQILKRHHYEPAWQMRSGRVMAIERVTLYGLTISDGQRIHFGDVNSVAAREIFIRDGLVLGDYRKPPAFLKANLHSIKEVQDLESRTRRRDLLVDEQALFDFYDERIPAQCVSASSLEKWVKQLADDKQLRLDQSQILTRDPGEAIADQFPSELEWREATYRLKYRFEPGKENDGISVTVPLPLLNRAPRYRFEWLVPGLLREKCIALVKGLPKVCRKQLVPVPDVVDAALASMQADDVALCSALSAALRRTRGVAIADEDWDIAGLAELYRANIRVVDERGKLLAQGRDMAALVAQFRNGADVERLSEPSNSPAQHQVKSWSFGDLPNIWRTTAAGMKVERFPALVDHGDRIAVELHDYQPDAELLHRRGVAALAMSCSSQTVKYLRKQLFANNKASLALAGSGLDRSVLVRETIMASLLEIWDETLPRDEAAFTRGLNAVKGQWVSTALAKEQVMINFLLPLAEAQKHLKQLTKTEFTAARADISGQIQCLLEPGFMVMNPGYWLEQYPRYGKALLHRIQRLNGQTEKDQKSLRLLEPSLTRLSEAAANYPGLSGLSPPALQYRWMLEEFRVSLFAQQLGTRLPVSSKRLDEQWQKVRNWLNENPR